MKSFARSIFRWLARRTLARFSPTIIGIAGSVGKTATKDAVAAAVESSARRVRKTEGNFNADMGVPVTIVAGGAAPRSMAGWIMLLVRSWFRFLRARTYPDAVVLEMGADKPGDLSLLLDIAPPKIGILTSTAPEHLEFFGDVDGVVAEESLIVRRLPPDGTAIVNIDDERSRGVVPALTSTVVTYGWSADADVRAESMMVTMDDHGLPSGMVIKAAVAGSRLAITLPGILGRHQAYPVLAALAAARALGDDPAGVAQRLSRYNPPPGRMRLLRGREQSVIIDDSYNASPEAMQAALQTVIDLSVPGKKFAILGQMSELGAAAADWHDRIGHLLTPKTLNHLVTVGPLAKRIGDAAITVGFPETRVHNVETAEAAAAVILPNISSGDVILLKGSRYAGRLERAAKILLADPERDMGKLVG